MLKLAKTIDRVAMKYDVDIIVTPQYTDISLLVQNTERILVFAQHMDSLPVGREVLARFFPRQLRWQVPLALCSTMPKRS